MINTHSPVFSIFNPFIPIFRTLIYYCCSLLYVFRTNNVFNIFDFQFDLFYNSGMQYSILLLLIFCFLPVGSAFANQTEDIDIFFHAQQNTNRFIHKCKSTKQNRQELSKEAVCPEPAKNISDSTENEMILTNLKKEKQEEEKRKYRELEELSSFTAQGIALYTDNNYDDSLNCFLKIPEKKRTPEVWLLIGNILYDQGKKEDAAFMYSRTILTDITYYKAYYNLGNLYLEDDKFNLAIEQYKSALKYCRNNPYVYYNLGCAYVKSGDLKKARYAFLRAIELKNTVADFHYNLAFVCKKLNKEKQAKIYLDNYNKLTGQAYDKPE